MLLYLPSKTVFAFCCLLCEDELDTSAIINRCLSAVVSLLSHSIVVILVTCTVSGRIFLMFAYCALFSFYF